MLTYVNLLAFLMLYECYLQCSDIINVISDSYQPVACNSLPRFKKFLISFKCTKMTVAPMSFVDLHVKLLY